MFPFEEWLDIDSVKLEPVGYGLVRERAECGQEVQCRYRLIEGLSCDDFVRPAKDACYSEPSVGGLEFHTAKGICRSEGVVRVWITVESFGTVV